MREYTDRQILDAMLRQYDLPTAIIIQKYKDQLAEPEDESMSLSEFFVLVIHESRFLYKIVIKITVMYQGIIA